MCLTRRPRFALRADTDPYAVRWEFVGRPSAPPSSGQGRGRSGENDGLVSIEQLLQPTNSASITMTITSSFTEEMSHLALAPSVFDERARRLGDFDSVPIPITVRTAATSVWMLAKYCLTASAVPLAMTCWPCGQRTTVYPLSGTASSVGTLSIGKVWVREPEGIVKEKRCRELPNLSEHGHGAV